MDYIELTCRPVSGNHITELLMAHLAGLGFESFIEENDHLLAYIPSGSFTPELEKELMQPMASELLSSYSFQLIRDQNWNALWESAYEPVSIDGKCLIRAPFHNPQPGCLFDIVIEPKMSFGTAHHETTRLMIRYLLDQDVQGKSLLDMGSGTGVLAILAARKGARPVTAIDNDEWAFRNAQENIMHNKTDQVEVLLGDVSLLKDRKFDIIYANINRNILLADIPVYRSALNSGGWLFMSGFYIEDLPIIQGKAKENRLLFVSSVSDNRWTAACFTAQ